MRNLLVLCELCNSVCLHRYEFQPHQVSNTSISCEYPASSLSFESNLKFQYFILNFSAFFRPLNFSVRWIIELLQYSVYKALCVLFCRDAKWMQLMQCKFLCLWRCPQHCYKVSISLTNFKMIADHHFYLRGVKEPWLKQSFASLEFSNGKTLPLIVVVGVKTGNPAKIEV